MSTNRLTFAGILRSELQKTWSVPGLRWLVLLTMPAITLTIIAAQQFSPGVAVAIGSMVGGAVFSLLGGLSIAGEYATGTIRTTLTAAPRRGTLVLAKGIAVTLTGLIVGWLGAAVGAAAIGVLGSAALSVLATGPAAATAGLFGLFLGLLIRRVAPTAIITLFGVFLLSGLIGGTPVGKGSIGDFLLSDSTVTLVAGTADWDRPLLVVVLWLAVAGSIAVLRLRKSDV